MSSDVNKIPRNDRFLSFDNSIERQRNIFSVHKELTLALDQLSAACIKEVHSLVGSDKLKSYKDFSNEMRAKFIEIPRIFKSTSESKLEEQDYRRKLVAKRLRFAKDLGIDKKRVEGVFKSYIKEAGEAYGQDITPKEEVPYVITDPEKAPKKTHNPWTWKYPPYDGEWSLQYMNGQKGKYWALASQNRYTGQIGAYSRISIYGADDSDWGLTDTMSENWVWYKMPAAGIVEAWMTLKNIDCYYGGCMEDEWGISDADITQQSRPYMQAISPLGGIRYGSLLDFHIGECDCCWFGKMSNANPGELRWVQFSSPQAYASNQWILIAFGIRDNNYVWLNDESADLSMTNRWFVNELAIRSSGAP